MGQVCSNSFDQALRLVANDRIGGTAAAKASLKPVPHVDDR